MSAPQLRTRASLEELQAAVYAARRGDYALHGAAAATPRGEPGAGPSAPSGASRWQPGGAVVAVIAAHSGAGASTVAVALAEAVCDAGRAVRVIEVADASRSGLAAASSAELGEDGTGWRRGRRGGIRIDRLALRVRGIDDVPVPGPPASAEELLVLDVGWPARAALAARGWLAHALTAGPLVIVCRPTVPGIRQTECLLAELAEQTTVQVQLAAVGPARWPGAVVASAGPRVRAARGSGRVITVPLDRRLHTDGVSADALPKALAAAGLALAAALPSIASSEHDTDHPAPGRTG